MLHSHQTRLFQTERLFYSLSSWLNYEEKYNFLLNLFEEMFEKIFILLYSKRDEMYENE